MKKIETMLGKAASQVVMFYSLILTLLIVICYLLPVSCNLFNAPLQPDYFDKIDEEIKWANAEKIKVTVAVPAGWGTSPQGGTDRCFDAVRTKENPRSGYPFNLEFTPELAYLVKGWRAYPTDALAGIGEWLTDPTLLEGTEIKNMRLDNEAFVFPEDFPARGGSGSFTLYASGPVTLVPWCQPEPYIIRTIPRDGADGITRDTDIVIYFNAPLALAANVELPELFEEGKISIREGVKLISDNNEFYNYPVYTASLERGEYKITISPAKVTGELSGVEVVVGPNIYNTFNIPMTVDSFSFGANEGSAGSKISYWEAEYDGKSIELNYKSGWVEEFDIEVKARYRIDGGGVNEIYSSKTIKENIAEYKYSIPNVSMPDFSRVRQGGEITGIREYEIFLDLYIAGIKDNGESVSFKIWNIAGMRVNETNTILLTQENFTETMQASMSNEQALQGSEAMNNYVLTSDISVENWEPVSFSDKIFYGNGHTITISGFQATYNGSNYGFFADVGTGAVIRDLTIMYEYVSVSPASEERFGGIAGTVSGGAVFENVLVKGAVTVNGSGEIYAGGMVGHISSTAANPKAAISNAYSGLSLTVNRYGFIGGAVGAMGTLSVDSYAVITVDDGAAAKLEKITVAGNITIGSNTNTSDFVNGVLCTGGLAGFVVGTNSFAVFKDSEYKNGTITIYSGYDSDYIGGLIGYIAGNADVQNSSSSAESIIFYKQSNQQAYSEPIYIGGFIGRLEGSDNIVKNSYSENPITTNIIRISSSVFIGGFAGWLNGDITYCYTKSDINIKGGTVGNYAGGFVGQGRDGSIKFCYASGNVNLVTENLAINYVGGFAGYITSFYINHSYALGDIYNVSEGSSINAGGFIGWADYSIENCFALGTVMAHYNLSATPRSIIVGGLIGYASGKIEKCLVAVHPRNLNSGMNLTATGGNRNIGRISGTNPVAGISNCYAWNGIRLFSDPRYDPSRPVEIIVPNATPAEDQPGDPIPTATNPRPAHDNVHGQNASSGFFRSRESWTGLGFTETIFFNAFEFEQAWDFVGIEGRGYPRLKTEDGGIMGGQ